MQIRNVYGIDLGTSTVKIYDLKKDTITKEKNMIAIRNREQVIAVGNYAYEMHERTPSNIEVITPMSNGRIANVLMVEAVLHTLLHRCTRHMGYRPELYFSVPCDMTEIERRSYYTIAHKGALKNCRMYLVDKPIADALALGIPINRTKGSMIVNIGAQSTEISVIANARVIFSRIIPVGGKQFNESICEEIKHALERTPPQIHDHIQKEGIYITGGSTRIPNIDRYLSRQLGCPVQLSRYYDLCTICGLKELITHDALHRWAYTVNKKK